jgi:serine/threonine protein phosphatase PrpC
MTQVGATFSLIQIRRDFITKKITVNVLTVGDSPVTIHCNGEKVLESAEHSWINKDEMERLRREKRIDRHEISPSNNFKLLNEETIVAEPSGYVNVGPCQLAMTQSLGHIQYSYGRIIDEKGLFGLAPFKATFIFDETDELNIKGYSDGVSDVVVEYLPQDVEFLKAANATETAELAKSRWEKTWDAVAKTVYDRAIAEGLTLVDIPKSKFSFGKTADDVCCVSWIQTRH